MPVELKDLKAKATRRLTINLGNEAAEGDEQDKLIFRWDPTKYTREIHETLRQSHEEGPEAENDPFKLAEACIVPLVPTWDITDEGLPWPVTAENVASLGLFLCTQMMMALMNDMGDFETVKKDSVARS